MILQKEIRDKSQDWRVPPETVDKDYVLGHFLAGFHNYYKNQLIFKGGTCLRKCYFSDYRFSEDLDFTACKRNFVLTSSDLEVICQKVEQHSGILLIPDRIKPLLHKNERKGDQVKIKFWGSNHPKNQAPTSSDRWVTRIKLEISTEELCLLPANQRDIYHPYSDSIISFEKVNCYDLKEIVAEKLRSLVQRSYAAPRDYYDLFMLTDNYTEIDWEKIRQLFLQKMKHKGIEYIGSNQLVDELTMEKASKAWKSSLAHQIKESTGKSPIEMIQEVGLRIKENL